METEKPKRPRIERTLGLFALLWSAIAVLAFVLAPTSIFVALAFLVIPLFVFAVAPTIAMWSVALWVLNEIIRRMWPKRWSLLIALALTTAIMTIIPFRENRWATHAYYGTVSERDILPATKLSLSGDVLILGPQFGDRNWRANKAMTGEEYNKLVPWSCNALCLATLGTADIKSVTVDEWGRNVQTQGLSSNARTYRLLPKARCPAVTAVPDLENGIDDEKWHRRLTTTECLVAGPARLNANFIIEIQKQHRNTYAGESAPELAWSFDFLPYSVDRLEIRDAADRLLFRQSIVRGSAFFEPLVIGLEMDMRGPTFFRWGRKSLSNAGPYVEIRPEESLSRYTNLQLR